MEARDYIARFSNDTAVSQSLAADATRVTWMRGGSAPELSQVAFVLPTEFFTMTQTVTGTRVSGGWEATDLALPCGRILDITALGSYGTGMHNSSGSVVERTVNLYIPCRVYLPLVIR
jgi:hypothetical protein